MNRDEEIVTVTTQSGYVPPAADVSPTVTVATEAVAAASVAAASVAWDEGVREHNYKIYAGGVIRNEKGYVVKGSPAVPGTGRKPVGQEVDIRRAIWKRYTMEQLLQRLDEAYEIAKKQQSARGIVAAVTPILEYGLGKPVQAVMVEQGRTDLLQQLLSSDKPLLPDRDEPKLIEGEVAEK